MEKRNGVRLTYLLISSTKSNEKNGTLVSLARSPHSLTCLAHPKPDPTKTHDISEERELCTR